MEYECAKTRTSLGPRQSYLSVSSIKGLSEFGKVIVDGMVLQPSAVCCQTLVQGNCISFGVLPVGDARRDLPLLLFLHCHLGGGGGGVSRFSFK